MEKKALFVGFKADAGHGSDVAEFLRGALGPVEDEPDTRDWYAIRFTDADYAVVDTFPGNAGRLKHLFGKVGRALPVKTFTILDGPPDINPADVLAAKPLTSGGVPGLALHLPLQVRADRKDQAERWVLDAAEFLTDEASTRSWYVLRLGSTSFAIVGFFATEPERDAFVSRAAASALAARFEDSFEGRMEFRPGDVLACKAAG